MYAAQPALPTTRQKIYSRVLLGGVCGTSEHHQFVQQPRPTWCRRPRHVSPAASPSPAQPGCVHPGPERRLGPMLPRDRLAVAALCRDALPIPDLTLPLARPRAGPAPLGHSSASVPGRAAHPASSGAAEPPRVGDSPPGALMRAARRCRRRHPTPQADGIPAWRRHPGQRWKVATTRHRHPGAPVPRPRLSLSHPATPPQAAVRGSRRACCLDRVRRNTPQRTACASSARPSQSSTSILRSSRPSFRCSPPVARSSRCRASSKRPAATRPSAIGIMARSSAPARR